MPMLLGDFGTTWTKILDSESGEYTILSSRDAAGAEVDVATGHNGQCRAPLFINELLALVSGGIARLGPGPWTLADIGSRDIKVVKVQDGQPVHMDWNNSCGALAGFTLELLGRYFQLDFSSIPPEAEGLPVTCGVLGMERLFDRVASGSSISSSVAAFVRGMATWSHAFMDRPSSFYLSGGLCDNHLFLSSFPAEVKVEPLGRFVLLDGLAAEVGKKGIE